ncbi:MAG TPA: hypothetical protein VJ954_05980 [Ignavibacteriaceae bacterium]|nr:hypothetical protein [Ignavibacteriaceae bacterium]
MDKNLDFQFNSFYRSATEWSEKGRGLLTSAEIINTELLSISIRNTQKIPDELTTKFGGLIDSLQLLLGFAIENAIKGNIIASRPDFKDISELNQYKFNDLGGHGIVNMVKANIEQISSSEIDLLDRLQESIIWAGRYNSPKYPINNKNINSIHPEFSSNDFKICSQLFEKIEKSTIKKWEKNETRYYSWKDSYLND